MPGKCAKVTLSFDWLVYAGILSMGLVDDACLENVHAQAIANGERACVSVVSDTVYSSGTSSAVCAPVL